MYAGLGLTLQPMDTSDIHNTPPIHNLPQLRSETVHRPRQINPDNPVPVIIIRLRYTSRTMRLANHTGDISRTIQSPVFLDDALDPGVYLRPLGDIHLGD
jgi:hypothetical protein